MSQGTTSGHADKRSIFFCGERASARVFHMRTLSSAELLDLWDRGARLHPLDRSLLALRAACGASDDVADWALGKRNRALFDLHASYFGAQLQGWSACPRCGEKAEFDVDGSLLMAGAQDQTEGAIVSRQGEHFRLPTSRDLAQVITGDPDSAARRLLERCRVSGGAAGEWNEEAMSEAEEALAAADPLAEIQLALGCPSCRHRWNDALDIGSFVWAEIDSRARRLLWEVHTLASAYGWNEPETLSLSPSRRATYLRMVQA